jgi:hypothetical protein
MGGGFLLPPGGIYSMKLLANAFRPLTAIMLLAACNGHDATTGGDPANAGQSSPHTSPLEIGQVTASVPLAGLPSCSGDGDGEVYLVEAPASEVGLYRCSQLAWQRVGGAAGASGPRVSRLADVPTANATLAKIAGSRVQVGVDDNDNGELDADEVDAAGTFADVASGSAEGGSAAPPAVDAGSTEPPAADAGATNQTPPDAVPTCGDGIVNRGEQCDLGAANGGADCLRDCSLPPLGSCISCAQNNCPDQYANAVGAASGSGNLADVSQLFECVIGAYWARGTPIPQTSCFFSDATQPAGSLLPCYCGSTPAATCLATGPANANEACAVQVELASHCSPVSASCVTASGSNPAVPLGDALQLLNCERAACQAECGFPAPIEE